MKPMGMIPCFLAAQQPIARLVPRALVFERHLAEPCEGVPDVRRIVDGQATPAARVDVGEGAVGKLRALLGAKRWHARMIARTDAHDSRSVGSQRPVGGPLGSEA